MPELKRPCWGGYYKTPRGTKLLGVDWYHTYECGNFTQDGIEYQLLFVFMYKEGMIDTQGLNQESFDIPMGLADDIIEGLEQPVPSVLELVVQDTIEGLDGWDIMERRIGVMIPEFCGFTFSEVLKNYPDMLQPTVVAVEGVEVSCPNIKQCNLEEEL